MEINAAHSLCELHIRLQWVSREAFATTVLRIKPKLWNSGCSFSRIDRWSASWVHQYRSMTDRTYIPTNTCLIKHSFNLLDSKLVKRRFQQQGELIRAINTQQTITHTHVPHHWRIHEALTHQMTRASGVSKVYIEIVIRQQTFDHVSDYVKRIDKELFNHRGGALGCVCWSCSHFIGQ